jgi:hypothetical protein
MYEEVIEVTLKDLCRHIWQERRQYPSYKQYMFVAHDAFWRG